MQITFYKYQGTGNDFVMIDNRSLSFPKEDTKLINKLCDRKFGVGADGLILLENDEELDFKMVYYNADGNESTMCGNGGRCLVAFANFLGVIKEKTTFNAVDGLHNATINADIVSLQMIDVENVKEKENYSFLNTGSPHHVQLVDDVTNFDVFTEGKKIRYGLYGEAGSNINFVAKNDNGYTVRTYERGVEDETLSCGTGVTAVAIAMHKSKNTNLTTIPIKVMGGNLEISFTVDKDGYKNVFLTGPAKQVFKGEIVC
ncbi:diaminopimelate epimerase [Cellulophaga omnivescoria]|uniref:diaminopimelate epimerase n=1 Tax=Cellulophaga omnivescoria TaxID=1888890 RepID=UPI0022F0D686|nr:diaminopimelate epimerase [Cellulophaga omnivescoria]WBU89425.1 diaminopimelate epimerase [Cellulophaga omnivescoria]